ncbi:hypothetical protein LNTAR_04331 [Lentisphaera araneosa HTCC2155]|uniref:Uncharacterized protein n=1 Tax=Lentisphaera araneosa HTCC2155 TaxID=313628 RepID=A6DQG5_9BACT|nr:hypothetical protein [Lentisphaera araneosa]EDM26046.1 hypothetical protein LNTAR_04331 [Lentisphaera araneosa HTCC2155]
MLYIINHKYHLDKIDLNDSDLIIIISPKKLLSHTDKKIIHLPMIESKPLALSFIYWLKYYILLFKLSKHQEKVCFFGIQDVFSFKLYNCFKKRHSSIKVVADNVEFFLRPEVKELPELRKLTFKSLIKLFIFGLIFDYYQGKIGFLGNRPVFSISGSVLCTKKSFFNVKAKNTEPFNEDLTFISQPYYLDHSIDFETYVDQLVNILKINNVNKIIFHPRDTKVYRNIILENNFHEFNTNSYIGIYSTMLFEMNLNGNKVKSIFKPLEPLFTDDYISFVKFISNNTGICLNGERYWELKSTSFDKLIELIGLVK